MPIVRAKTERRFNPHSLLLRAAQHHLETAKQNKPGCYYDWLAVIVLSALSIEAIGNSYGKVLIPNWKELIADLVKKKQGASPIKKLQLVAAKCGINADFEKHPWATARNLTEFRDRIAHAKREHFKEERDCNMDNYGEVMGKRFYSDIEKVITEDFAKQSCEAVEQIIKDLNKTLKRDQLFELTYDGHESSARVM
jgi:hypothetical protein